MNPSFIYFDLDNTLLDHNSAEEKAQQAIYKNNPELQTVSMKQWLETYQAINHQLWLKYQSGEIDRFELQRSRFHDSMAELGMDTVRSNYIGDSYMQNYRDYWNWIEGAKEALEVISQKYQTGIITNGFRETQNLKFEKLNIRKYCSHLVISEEVGELKPHPKVFDHATELAGVERDQILYIGDSHSSDITGGYNAGWKTAWYTGKISRNGEAKIADLEFDNFDDLIEFLDSK